MKIYLEFTIVIWSCKREVIRVLKGGLAIARGANGIFWVAEHHARVVEAAKKTNGSWRVSRSLNGPENIFKNAAPLHQLAHQTRTGRRSYQTRLLCPLLHPCVATLLRSSDTPFIGYCSRRWLPGVDGRLSGEDRL